MESAGAGEDIWIPSVCRVCSNCCGIRVRRKDGVVVKIEGLRDSPHNAGRICAKGLAAIMSIYDPDRPRRPLIRTNPRKGIGIDPEWRELSWDEAMETVAAKLARVMAEDPRKLVILRGVGEPDWVGSCVGAFARTFGTPNFAGGPVFATHVDACYLINGTMHVEIDVPRCRYLLLFGAQRGGAVNHDAMRAAREIAEARRRGMRLVVIDPICSPVASQADEWVPIRPGTDGALALAMMHVLLNEMGVFDRDFLRNQTNAPYLIGADGHYIREEGSARPLVWDELAGHACAFDAVRAPALEGEFTVAGKACKPALAALREHLQKNYAPEVVAEITTVSPETIRRLARTFGESAMIGGTVTIEGQTLPYRPVCAFCDSRGLSSHQFGMWACMNVHMLNVLVGALDVPGGCLSTNLLGPGEKPRVEESDEGLVVGPGEVRSYPAGRPRAPETINLRELFPTGRAMGTVMMGLSLVQRPDLLPYKPEILILNNFNVMMSGAGPKTLAEAIGRFRWVVFLGDKLTETAELADVVLPLRQHAERLDFSVNSMRGWVNGDHWYYTLRQPVLAEKTEARHPVEVYMELARRLNRLEPFIERFNSGLGLKEPYRLEATPVPSVEEILERHIRSTLGPEYGLETLREKGFVAFPRTLAERFPRALKRLPRVPIYFEFLLETGAQLEQAAAEFGLKIDCRSFRALPSWHPCAAQEHAPSGYDLIAVNYKLPFHSYNMTQDNPWLAELAEHHPYAYNLLISAEAARARGIADGDLVELETPAGARARAIARVSQCIHPEVVGIASCFGQWAKARRAARGRGIHFNSLVPYGLSQIDPMAGLMDACVKVKVIRLSADKPSGAGRSERILRETSFPQAGAPGRSPGFA
ncbi:MAG TPA: molybdopterin-dependent oxidoreductase [candidate division Zixibacteria bacterium]|nr:molybdopterin-dependent oxidoreductase [candidate division Zixibacteria bacterium]